MKYLKMLWDKCGEEDFTLKVLLATTTLLTIHTVTTLDNPPTLNGIIIALNVIVAVIYFYKDE